MQAPVIFQPPVRMVAILAETCPATDDLDPDKYQIVAELYPVVAIQCSAPAKNHDAPAYEPVIVVNGEIRCDRSSTSVHVCPWPPEEDQARLQEEIETLKTGLRVQVEYLRKQGEPAFHTAATYLAEKEREKLGVEEGKPEPRRRGRKKSL